MYMLIFIVVSVLFKSITALEINRIVIEDSNGQVDRLDLKTMLDIISRSRKRSQSFRRTDERVERIKYLYDFLRTKIEPSQLKSILRQNEGSNAPTMGFEALIESELKNALSLKTSALNDRPIVQKSGKNDFLVMKPDVLDPFVTVVPNNIYYNIEKKCVNWLDDCNLQGIRARLLQKVKSPFK